jgi:hypothetical protein
VLQLCTLMSPSHVFSAMPRLHLVQSPVANQAVVYQLLSLAGELLHMPWGLFA